MGESLNADRQCRIDDFTLEPITVSAIIRQEGRSPLPAAANG
jgi:hypothetical protein